MVILVDAMGGDNAPDAVIKGAVKAVNEIDSEIMLIGNKDIINSRVKELFGKEKIEDISSKFSTICTNGYYLFKKYIWDRKTSNRIIKYRNRANKRKWIN